MSYQVLARKWRPANFDQVVGQSHVLHALTNALSQQRLHHAYLFTGTRGVGKTSLARLFAKGLNCETGVTANPCGKCASCVEIAEGRFVDLIEVDAASRTKVDDTRELLDNVQYRPSRGRFKVYLIDEVHMLSRSSFNALLKTLEEPPEHVKFLLATTDPQKLPVTVLSRCLQFNLKSLTQDDIAGQLDHVLTQEQLPFEPQALTLLAKSANGSMRDALSLTDQAIAFGAGQVMLQQVQTMLGTIDEQQVIALLDALLKGDIANLMHLTAQILSYGAEADEVLRSLLELLHQITLTQFAPAASQMSLYSEQIKGFAGRLKPEQIQLYYQILLTGRKDLPHAPDPKSGLEMALLRAVAFLPESVAGHWTPAREGEGTPGKGKPAGGATGTELASAASTASPTTAAQTSAKTAAAAEAKPQSVALPAADNDANLNLTTDAKADANADSDIEPDAAAIGDDDTAMLAEQALLLSQAESMGYGEPSQPEDSGKTLKEEDKASTPAAESDKLQTGSTQPEPLPKQTSADTSLSRQTAHQTALQGADLQASAEVNDAAEALTMTADSESAFTDDADSHDNSYPASGEDDLSSYEQYFTGVDDFLPVDDSLPAEDALLAEGAYSPADGSYSQADGSYTPDAGMAGNAVTDMSSLSFEHTERSGIQPAPVVSTQVNSTAPALDDDFLDSVLAARDSLLAGLKLDDEPEDGAAQVKTVVKTPVKTPGKSQIPAKPEASKSAEPELSGAEPASLPNDLNGHSESLSSAAPVQHTENQNLSTEQEQSQYRVHHSAADTQDRPPWEEPAEQPVAVMPDKQDTFSAEFSAHDEMSDVEEAPTDEIFDNLTPEQEAQSPSLQESPQAEGSAQQAATAVVQSHPLPALASEVTGHELDLHWYKQMSALKIGGRVRQLAVNSVCYAWSEQIELLLKPDQKHLAAAVAIEQLRAALVEVAGFELTVNIQIGSDEQRETPREVRSRFHSELLAQARSALHQDDNIRWLMGFMGAQLDDDSVVYPPELLSLKGRSIPELGSQ